LPLYKRHRVIESVLNGCLGLYNKPKAVMNPEHKLMGPKEEEEKVNARSNKRNVKVKVKQSRYRPGVAQRVPGS